MSAIIFLTSLALLISITLYILINNKSLGISDNFKYFLLGGIVAIAIQFLFPYLRSFFQVFFN